MTVECCGTNDGAEFRKYFVRPRWRAVLLGLISRFNGWAARRIWSFTYCQYLASLWSEMLGSRARPDDNSFDLGGHAALVVQMVNRVPRDSGLGIHLIRLAPDTPAEVAADLPTPVGIESQVPSAGEGIGKGLGRLLALAGATKR